MVDSSNMVLREVHGMSQRGSSAANPSGDKFHCKAFPSLMDTNSLPPSYCCIASLYINTMKRNYPRYRDACLKLGDSTSPILLNCPLNHCFSYQLLYLRAGLSAHSARPAPMRLPGEVMPHFHQHTASERGHCAM